MTTEEIKAISELLDKAYENGFEAGQMAVMTTRQGYYYKDDVHRNDSSKQTWFNNPVTVSENLSVEYANDLTSGLNDMGGYGLSHLSAECKDGFVKIV